MKEKEDK